MHAENWNILERLRVNVQPFQNHHPQIGNQFFAQPRRRRRHWRTDSGPRAWFEKFTGGRVHGAANANRAVRVRDSARRERMRARPCGWLIETLWGCEAMGFGAEAVDGIRLRFWIVRSGALRTNMDIFRKCPFSLFLFTRWSFAWNLIKSLIRCYVMNRLLSVASSFDSIPVFVITFLLELLYTFMYESSQGCFLFDEIN